MVRGTGKFKQKRGGGRSFSKHMHFDKDPKDLRRDNGDPDEEDEDGDEEDEEDEDEEEEDEDEDEEQPELTRTQRKELKKQQAAEKQKQDDEEEEDPDLINPNHVQKKLTISDLNNPRELTRREKEQKEKAEAKDKYWKESHRLNRHWDIKSDFLALVQLHVQGQTQEAKADLARLAKIRAERDAAQAKRKAEAEAKAAEIEAKKQAQLAKHK